MNDTVLRFCRTHDLLPEGSAVTCAVSGGADSMALLRCLLELRSPLHLNLSAAHFNHGLRGEESDGDEAFVRAFCEENGIPLTVGHGDAAACAKAEGISVETAARDLRYAFFSQLSGLIATAHTADDNAETVLMNLIRGSGLKGLCGIPLRRDRIIRPMLCVTREDVLAYLRKTNTHWREDSTNALDDCRRNRIRHAVIPLLKAENPALSETILAESLRLRSEDDYLAQEAAALLAQFSCDQGLDCAALIRQPEALQRRIIFSLLQAEGISDATHTETVRSLARSAATVGQETLPGSLTAVKSYGFLRLVRDTLPPLQSRTLPVPGSLELPEIGMTVRCDLAESNKPLPPDAILLNFDSITGPLTVRARKTGDILPLSSGSRSLKKLMIDRKIPAANRTRIPVLAIGDTVLAVHGLGIHREYAPVPGHATLAIVFSHRLAEV